MPTVGAQLGSFIHSSALWFQILEAKRQGRNLCLWMSSHTGYRVHMVDGAEVYWKLVPKGCAWGSRPVKNFVWILRGVGSEALMGLWTWLGAVPSHSRVSPA